MAITQGFTYSFKQELMQGVHAFGTDTFKIALYSSSANLDPSNTIAYSSLNEIVGAGYTAGGKTLTNVAAVEQAGITLVDFDDVAWTSAFFTCRGALMYNASKGNKAVLIFDFGADKTALGNTFTLVVPPLTPTTAVIRLSS